MPTFTITRETATHEETRELVAALAVTMSENDICALIEKPWQPYARLVRDEYVLGLLAARAARSTLLAA